MTKPKPTPEILRALKRGTERKETIGPWPAGHGIVAIEKHPEKLDGRECYLAMDRDGNVHYYTIPGEMESVDPEKSPARLMVGGKQFPKLTQVMTARQVNALLEPNKKH